LYEALDGFDGDDCAAEARRAAMAINDIGSRATGRRRRQSSTDDEADPVFTFMTVATTIDPANTGGNGGGAAFFTMSYSVLFAATLLALFM